MRKTIRVVMIDDNEAVLSSVKKYFKENEIIEIVGTYKDGKEGLEYLKEQKEEYDLVLLDILLPRIDGIKILEEMRKSNISKKVIVLSSFKDDYTIKKIQKLGAEYYLLKPVELEVLEGRIEEIFKEKIEVKKENNLSVEIEVSTILHDLGIPSHVKGYRYIREGIMLLYTEEEANRLITKEIYPEIATKYQTTATRVERAIRHAIEISWIRGDIKLMEKIFGNSVDFERSRPTNSEFLTTIADRIKLKRKEYIG